MSAASLEIGKYAPKRDARLGVRSPRLMLHAAAERARENQGTPFDKIALYLEDHEGRATVDELAQASGFEPQRVATMSQSLHGILKIKGDEVSSRWLKRSRPRTQTVFEAPAKQSA